MFDLFFKSKNIKDLTLKLVIDRYEKGSCVCLVIKGAQRLSLCHGLWNLPHFWASNFMHPLDSLQFCFIDIYIIFSWLEFMNLMLENFLFIYLFKEWGVFCYDFILKFQMPYLLSYSCGYKIKSAYDLAQVSWLQVYQDELNQL
jgi:hypothetical protein